MANRSNTQYSAFDTRRYLRDEDYKLILDYSFGQYNGKGYQQYGYFGQKQLTRVWGNVVKQDEIIVKASALGVGAAKPMRSTSGYERYSGSIPKIGHGVKIGEDDLLHLQEVAAASQNREGAMYQLMLDATIKQSNQLIIGMQNKLTSWVYEALSTGIIHNADLMVFSSTSTSTYLSPTSSRPRTARTGSPLPTSTLLTLHPTQWAI